MNVQGRKRSGFERALAASVVLFLLLPSCAILRGKGREPRPRTTDSGLVILDVGVPPDGEVAAPGDLVTLEYAMRLRDGTVVDASTDRGRPLRFRLGEGAVPAGLEEGLVGMTVLGRRRLTLPPALAYGDEGRPPRVPPGATLVIDVELLELEREPTPHEAR